MWNEFNCVVVWTLEKAMATHSSTLAWQIPWTEEPGRLQSMVLLGVRYDWATSLSLSCIVEGNGNPLQYSGLEDARDRRAWWAAIYGVAQSRTQLKWLSSSSLNILWHCPSLGSECKLTFSNAVDTVAFSKFAGIFSAVLWQHHILGLNQIYCA